MKSATVFLIVLLTGSRSNCYPVSEDELAGDGNWLSDEVLEEALSPPFLDPEAIKSVAVRPPKIVLPPTVDFQIPMEEILRYISVSDGDMRYSENPIIPSQPSRFLEPPTREFGSETKTMGIYSPFYSPAPVLENFKVDYRNQRTSEILPYGSPFSHQFPATATRFPSPVISGPKLDQVKNKEQKKHTKLPKDVPSKDSESLKKLELKQPKGTQVQQITPVAPVQYLVAPVNEFKVHVPRILLPPTREFSISDDM